MLEERYTQIERDNRLLLGKMNAILKTSNLDNINKQQPRSLNAGIRKKELQRIMDGNMKILGAIQNRKGCIDTKEFENHERSYMKYRKMAEKNQAPRIMPTLYDKTSKRNNSAPIPRTLDPLKKQKKKKQWKGSVEISNGLAVIDGYVSIFSHFYFPFFSLH